jgi:RNA polymerase sigma-70 factor (ECF subfamily)
VEPRPQSPADQELVARSIEGDARAFELLVQRHRDAVYWMVRGLVGREDAADVAQEVFLRAYHALPRFRGESRLDTWILRIARNRCYTLLKKRGRSPEIQWPDPGVDDPAAPLAATSDLPDRILAETEVAARVREAVDGLEPPYRTLIALYHFQGMTYDAIAEVMEMPVGTVKSYIHRGRRRLRDAVLDDAVLRQRLKEITGTVGREIER